LVTKSGDPISISKNIRFIAVKTKVFLLKFSFNRSNFTISSFSANLGIKFRSLLQVSSFNPSFRCHDKVAMGQSEDSRASGGNLNSIRDNFVWDSTVLRGLEIMEFLRLSFIGNSGGLVEANRVASNVLRTRTRNGLTEGTRERNVGV
jgi:hypothetical protein